LPGSPTTLGTGINMGQAYLLLHETFSGIQGWKCFPNHSLFGQVWREKWLAFSKNPK
jgi:hypothetical protein